MGSTSHFLAYTSQRASRSSDTHPCTTQPDQHVSTPTHTHHAPHNTSRMCPQPYTMHHTTHPCVPPHTHPMNHTMHPALAQTQTSFIHIMYHTALVHHSLPDTHTHPDSAHQQTYPVSAPRATPTHMCTNPLHRPLLTHPPRVFTVGTPYSHPQCTIKFNLAEVKSERLWPSQEMCRERPFLMHPCPNAA